jgi:hypothetical protein
MLTMTMTSSKPTLSKEPPSKVAFFLPHVATLKGGYFFDAYFSPILSPVADLRALGYTYMPPN